ncbi:MAG: HNH endonuclease [Candidatus Thalassarchaeaceae archaeon]|nr:HNH endonuclease [Candidatus Thalassarchaeaceae archaeon]
MQFWWVSQNKTWKHERKGGYLWAPYEGSDGVDRYYWRNMEEIQSGDVIFSYQGKKIRAVSIAKYDCYPDKIPPEFGVDAPWKAEGRRVEAEYKDLENPILLDDMSEILTPYLNEDQFPIKKNGKGGKEGYLFRVNRIVGEDILAMCELSHLPEISDEARSFGELPRREITSRKRLIDARIGQGYFRKQLINNWESCAVTGTGNTAMLTASHIRPWRWSNNFQRLDPNNGLLLTPAYDRAFDQGLITFDEGGSLIPSTSIDSADLLRSGIQPLARLRRYDDVIEGYMSFHREKVFVE